MLGPLPDRYLTDLGAEPYQEFAVIHGFSVRVRNSGPIFRVNFLVWVRVSVILVYGVIISMSPVLRWK